MIKMNKKMSDELRYVAHVKLPLELKSIADQGFFLKDGCFLLVAKRSLRTNATINSFLDRTGYECFINSIHIDDYVESYYLAYAYCFVNECLIAWRGGGNTEVLQAILSSDESGAVVKFHIIRESESWVSDNLDGYKDSILLIDSNSSSLNVDLR